MPTYQYRCADCGAELEAVQRFSDDPLVECPSCQGSLRKVFSPVGVVFKGSGFYATDSRSTKSKKGTTGSSDASKAKSATGDSGTSTAAAASSSSAGSTSPSSTPAPSTASS